MKKMIDWKIHEEKKWKV